MQRGAAVMNFKRPWSTPQLTPILTGQTHDPASGISKAAWLAAHELQAAAGKVKKSA